MGPLQILSWVSDLSDSDWSETNLRFAWAWKNQRTVLLLHSCDLLWDATYSIQLFLNLVIKVQDRTADFPLRVRYLDPILTPQIDTSFG